MARKSIATSEKGGASRKPDYKDESVTYARRMAYVPLAEGKGPAVLYEEDYKRITKGMRATPNWSLDKNGNYEYVKFNSQQKVKASGRQGGGATSVARLIMNREPKDASRVSYLDRDPCNLRRENLIVRGARQKNVTAKMPPVKKVPRGAKVTAHAGHSGSPE